MGSPGGMSRGARFSDEYGLLFRRVQVQWIETVDPERGNNGVGV